MPGPKMGARPIDFDENIVRQAPTFQKWLSLTNGQRLRYACRDFIKGHGDDEERLMRRIMIARRNNLRDHEMLKRARTVSRGSSGPVEAAEILASKRKAEAVVKNPPDSPSPKKRRSIGTGGMTDAEVIKEIDTPAVEATRSYKSWMALEDGKEFTYNQKYIKGKEGHDWLLKKNIWRRMRYRRENKKMVEKMKTDAVQVAFDAATSAHATTDHAIASAAAAAAATATHIVDHALLAGTAAAAAVTAPTPSSSVPSSEEHVAAAAAASSAEAAASATNDLVHKAVVEAAVAAAESYVQKQRESESAESAAAAAAAAVVVATGEAAVAAVGDNIGAIAAMQPPVTPAAPEDSGRAIATAVAAAAADAVNNPILNTAHMAPTPKDPANAVCQNKESVPVDVSKVPVKAEENAETPNPLASVVTGSALHAAAQLAAVAAPQQDGDASTAMAAESAINEASGVKVEAI